MCIRDRFCRLPPEDIIHENEFAIAIYDKFPVNRGHALIIPKRHEPSFFAITSEERDALFVLLERAKEELDRMHKPDGYNIGINCGEAAGQTIFHLHVHLIPRYGGDVEKPRGGVRNIKRPLVEY